MKVRLATAADDAALRALTRGTPMPGRVRFAVVHGSDPAAQTVVAERDGRLIACGRREVRERFVNGVLRPTAYLSGLRSLGSGRAVVRGYGLLRDLHERDGRPPTFTSVMADNAAALRLFSRTRRGLPRYEMIGRFVTHVIPVRALRSMTTTVSGVACHARSPGKPSYSHLMTRGSCGPAGRSSGDSQTSRTAVRRTAATAVADARRSATNNPLMGGAFRDDAPHFSRPARTVVEPARETVVVGYAGLYRLLRPLLPPVGEPLRIGCLTAAGRADPRAAQGEARRRGWSHVLYGSPRRDAGVRGRVLDSRLFAVRWPGDEWELDGRAAWPEVADL